MGLETRKERMDHMFALMNEVRVLVGRLEPHDTGEIHTTINILNGRVEELKLDLSRGNGEIQENLFNRKREDPYKEGTD